MDWEAKLAWAEAEHERRLAVRRRAGRAGGLPARGHRGRVVGGGARRADARPATTRPVTWLLRAADEYDTSWRAAPPGSWGRPIAMIRCRLMAGDHEGARADASAAVDAGVLDAPGPIGGYCAALALLVARTRRGCRDRRGAGRGRGARAGVGRGCARRARAGRRRGIRRRRVAPCCGRSRSATRSSRTSASPTRCSSSTRSRPLVASNCRRCRPRCFRASRSPRRARGRGSSPPGWR